jgi:hypothetical protein
MVEQALNDGVQDSLRDAEPWTAWTRRVEPSIKDLIRGCADRIPEFDFHRFNSLIFETSLPGKSESSTSR